MTSNLNNIKGLDGLRAVSISMVMVAHLELLQNFFHNHPQFARAEYLLSGTAGVNVFFCLSGFLITRLLLVEKQTSGHISLRKFYARRLFRLVPPLFILVSAVSVLSMLGLLHIEWWNILAAFLYLYNYMPTQFIWPELSSTWSLALEEQYYFLWPLALVFFSNRRKLFLFAGTMIVACIIAIPVLNGLAIPYNGKSYLLTNHFKVSRLFIPAVAPIIIGSVFSLLSLTENALKHVSRHSIWLLLAAVIFYACPLHVPVTLLPFVEVLQAIGVGCLLLYIYVQQNSSLLVKVLETAPLKFIGKVSYGIYIYQSLFLTTGTEGALWFQQFPQNIMLTLVVAVFSFYFLEKPIMALRNKWFSK